MEKKTILGRSHSEWQLANFVAGCELILTNGGRIEICYCGRVYQIESVDYASGRLIIELNSEKRLKIVCVPGELVLVLYPPQ